MKKIQVEKKDVEIEEHDVTVEELQKALTTVERFSDLDAINSEMDMAALVKLYQTARDVWANLLGVLEYGGRAGSKQTEGFVGRLLKDVGPEFAFGNIGGSMDDGSLKMRVEIPPAEIGEATEEGQRDWEKVEAEKDKLTARMKKIWLSVRNPLRGLNYLEVKGLSVDTLEDLKERVERYEKKKAEAANFIVKASELHRQATDMFSAYLVVVEKREDETPDLELVREALKLEKEALSLIDSTIQPSYAVICKSAVNIAMEVKDYAEAARLAKLKIESDLSDGLRMKLDGVLRRAEEFEKEEDGGVEMEVNPVVSGELSDRSMVKMEEMKAAKEAGDDEAALMCAKEALALAQGAIGYLNNKKYLNYSAFCEAAARIAMEVGDYVEVIRLAKLGYEAINPSHERAREELQKLLYEAAYILCSVKRESFEEG